MQDELSMTGRIAEIAISVLSLMVMCNSCHTKKNISHASSQYLEESYTDSLSTYKYKNLNIDDSLNVIVWKWEFQERKDSLPPTIKSVTKLELNHNKKINNNDIAETTTSRKVTSKGSSTNQNKSVTDVSALTFSKSTLVWIVIILITITAIIFKFKE